MERGRKFVEFMRKAVKERLRKKGKTVVKNLMGAGEGATPFPPARTDTVVSPYGAQGGATLGSRVRQYNAAEARKKELAEFAKKQARIKKMASKKAVK